MTAIRYGLRVGLGTLLLASMFAVPMMTARAGGSGPYTMTVDHAPPDGPDPVPDHVDVVDKTGDDAQGFIPAEGGKIKTDGQPDEQDNTNSVIRTFNGSGPGGVFELHDLAPGDPGYEDICGNGNCDGKVIEVEVPDGYTHRQNP